MQTLAPTTSAPLSLHDEVAARLREQGLTFSALVDKQRQELATYYMRQQQLPIFP